MFQLVSMHPRIMSLAVDRGFGVRASQRIEAPEAPHVAVRAPLHPVVYSLKTTFAGVALSTAPARRLPELDSHAIATSSSLGAFMAVVISLFDPHALPSQIHAFASLSVTSAPINPIWSLPFFGARSISAYWMSAAWPVSSRQF